MMRTSEPPHLERRVQSSIHANASAHLTLVQCLQAAPAEESCVDAVLETT